MARQEKIHVRKGGEFLLTTNFQICELTIHHGLQMHRSITVVTLPENTPIWKVSHKYFFLRLVIATTSMAVSANGATSATIGRLPRYKASCTTSASTMVACIWAAATGQMDILSVAFRNKFQQPCSDVRLFLQFRSHIIPPQNNLSIYVPWLLPTTCLQKPHLTPLGVSLDGDNVASEFHGTYKHYR